MNPYTGELARIGDDESMQLALKRGMSVLPKELEDAAKAVLAGKLEARVNLAERGPLQDWAKKKRKEKIAAKSRRRNRA